MISTLTPVGFKELEARLREVDDEGSVLTTDGVLLIRKDRPRPDGLFPLAYLHEIFAPLCEQEIQCLEQLIERQLPQELANFYRCANGLTLFSASLSISGLRKDYSRRPGTRLPVSLEYGNTKERPSTAPCDHINLGFYSYGDGYHVWMTPSGMVYVTAGSLSESIRSWHSLWAFLDTEIDRLVAEFHRRAGAVDLLNPLPPPL